MSASVKIKACAQLLAATLVAVAGAAVAATAVGHAIDPQHVGLWTGPNEFFFGMLRGTTLGAHQLPASTLYIVAVMVVGICWFVSRELLAFARANLARHAR